MKPIKFDIANILFTKPEGMTDEECSPLHGYKSNEQDEQHPFILTAWEPSAEDLKTLNAGKPIWLKTAGYGFAPTALFTVKQEQEDGVEFISQKEFSELTDLGQWEYLIAYKQKDRVKVRIREAYTFFALPGYEEGTNDGRYLRPRDTVGREYGSTLLLQALGFKDVDFN